MSCAIHSTTSGMRFLAARRVGLDRNILPSSGNIFCKSTLSIGNHGRVCSPSNGRANNLFLNEIIEKEVYMDQPGDFWWSKEGRLVCRLLQTIYGFKCDGKEE